MEYPTPDPLTLRKAGMSGLGFGVLRAVSGLLAAGAANLLMKAFS